MIFVYDDEFLNIKIYDDIPDIREGKPKEIIEIPDIMDAWEFYKKLVRCKECKHRPIKEDANEADYGFNVIAPNRDERCPCLVEDGWYSWMPKDNFFCGYGERREQ